MQTCAACGQTQALTAKFCAKCGAPLAGAPAGVETSAPASGQPELSTLAVVALVLALIPICPLIGVILGVVALVRIQNRPKELRGQGLAIAAIAVPIAAVPIIGILAAIAIPNFIKYQSRSKQSEARMNLKMLYTLERSYEVENNHPARSLADLDGSIEATRYAYFFGGDSKQPKLGGPYEIPAQFAEAAHAPDVVAVAVSNIDGDPTLDVWVIDKEGELKPLSDDVSN